MLAPLKMESQNGTAFVPQPDGSILVQNPQPTDVFVLQFTTPLTSLTGLKLEALCDDSLPEKGPGWAGGNFVLSEISLSVAPKEGAAASRAVALDHAVSTFSQFLFPVSNAIDGNPATGWAVGSYLGHPTTAVFETRGDESMDEAAVLWLKLEFHRGGQHLLGRLRVSATAAQKPVARGVLEREWEFARAAVDVAMDNGVEYLLALQLIDGSWAERQREYRNGQTALCLYTLLKCGVPKDHHSVRRAVEYLRAAPPTQTYAMALEIMALIEVADPQHREWIEGLAATLHGWHRGGFAYPHGGVDLSNTQYGALGMRAAARYGVKFDQETWLKLGAQVLRHQEKGRGPYDPQGFSYGIAGEVNGSITAAGVGILAVCEEQLGPGLSKEFANARKRGVEWLARNFAVARNPRTAHQQWVYYYLYGLERVAGLLDLDFIGVHDWYREGALFLSRAQQKDGSWKTDFGEPQCNTCFALLFLAQATSSKTGEVAKTRGTHLYGKDDPGKDISVRASGDTPLTMWVSSFGAAARKRLEWPGEEGLGLRVERVEFLRMGRSVMPDARGTAGLWRYVTEAPAEGWNQPAFDDHKWSQGPAAFGLMSSDGTLVRTPWNSDEIWLRRELVLEDDKLVEPVLLVHHSNAAPMTSGAPRDSAILCLFEDEETFASNLVEGDGSIEVFKADVNRGACAVRVTPAQRFRASIPGWFYPIRRSPKEGEYRYLRFAWRKEGEGGVMIQLAINGGWGEAQRYYAGENTLHWEPAIQVDKRSPKGWVTVTRDLYTDLGKDAQVTGIALTPMAGQWAAFDSIYLLRNLTALKNLAEMGGAASVEAAPADAAAGASAAGSARGLLEIDINGRRVYETATYASDYATIVPLVDLREVLKRGRNLVALHAVRAGPGQSIDLGIEDFDLLASLKENPSLPCGGKRFAARHEFPQIGKQKIAVRVYAQAPDREEEVEGAEAPAEAGEDARTDTGGQARSETGGHSEENGRAESEVKDETTAPMDAAEPGDEPMQVVILQSDPLEVDIQRSADPDLLAYAMDSARNLIARNGATARASSEFAGYPATYAVDNLQALMWLCGDGDPEPRITLSLNSPVRADRVLITLAAGSRIEAERTSRAQRVEIIVNGKSPRVIDVVPDDRRKTVFALQSPTLIRKLDLKIVSRSSGHPTKNAVGFAEIELQLLK